MFLLLFVFFYFFPLFYFFRLGQRLLDVKIGWELVVENKKLKLQISLFPLDMFCPP